MIRFVVLVGCMASSMLAQTTLKILNETVPPGGAAQLKFMLTSPQPVSTGRFGFFAENLAGVSLFSPDGDAFGTAVLNGTNLTVSMVSPSQSLGTASDYPILTVTEKVPTTAAVGSVTPLAVDSVLSFLSSALGLNFPLELKPGTLTIGGSVSITDVIPGGGLVRAGQTIQVKGVGFSPTTRLRLRNVLLNATVSYISPNEMDVVLDQDLELEGTLFQAKNKDNSISEYYSYMRGIEDGSSAQDLLNATEPVFARNTLQEAILPATLGPLDKTQFVALALQNTDTVSSTITIEQCLGKQCTPTVFTLEPRHRIVRDTAEWFGAPAPLGTYWHIVSTSPIQMLRMMGDNARRTVQPLPLTPVTPGTFQP